MAERALRGARLGGQSFEDERGVEMAPRQEIEYGCAEGERFMVTMSTEADVPLEWEHPKSGKLGRWVDGGDEAGKEEKAVRSHWDMLLERRSVPELEDILKERVSLLRGGQIGPPHLHRKSKKKSASS